MSFVRAGRVCRILKGTPRHHWGRQTTRGYATREDTIYALSSAPGRAGVAVLRVSGPDAIQAITRLSSLTEDQIRPRYAHLLRLHAPDRPEDVLDTALAMYFPKPRSFTGEDTVELHVHGGRAVVMGVTEALSSLRGSRPAEAGEFTRRAFEYGKLDLTQVEGLGDLLAAETDAQRRQALRQTSGAYGRVFERWRGEILGGLASAEAVIDFGEDEELPVDTLAGVAREMGRLRGEIEAQMADGRRGERLRSGLHVTLCGAPNAGKSSLLNQLTEREAAIVSPEAGTTRDIVEVALDLQGLPVLLSDTAGLRSHGIGPIEAEGISRARRRMQESDLIVLLADAASIQLEEAQEYLREMVGNASPHLVVLNKADLAKTEHISNLSAAFSPLPVAVISCATGEGVSALVSHVVDLLRPLVPSETGRGALEGVITQARHRQHLVRTVESLSTAQSLLEEDVVLGAEELRAAADSLGRLTGRIEVEEVLGRIFDTFCIGK